MDRLSQGYPTETLKGERALTDIVDVLSFSDLSLETVKDFDLLFAAYKVAS
jgi:hypothetical protein